MKAIEISDFAPHPSANPNTFFHVEVQSEEVTTEITLSRNSRHAILVCVAPKLNMLTISFTTTVSSRACMPMPLTACVHAADVCRKEITEGGGGESERRGGGGEWKGASICVDSAAVSPQGAADSAATALLRSSRHRRAAGKECSCSCSAPPPAHYALGARCCWIHEK